MVNLFYNYQINLIMRILLAGLCGMIIGFERKNRAKEAGIRTHFVVACASALMMIISKYSFRDVVSGIDGMRGADGARIAAQVVSGVGFLGAGIIYFQRGAIKGLTTAAGVWATSGIGMAIGAGMYTIGVASTFILLLAQIALHSSSKYTSIYKNKLLKIYGVETENFQSEMTLMLSDMGVNIMDISVKENELGTYDYSFSIELPKDISEEVLVKKIPCRSSIDFAH